MSAEEKEQNQENREKFNSDNELNIVGSPNNLILDLYDDETLNISLEEGKPLFTKLYSNIKEKISSVKNENENENDTVNEFLTSFETLFKNQIDIINSCIKNNEPYFMCATNVLVAQIKIFNFFNVKYLDEFLIHSDSESSKILKLISDNMSKTVNKLVDIIFKLHKKSNQINNDVLDLQRNNNINETYIKQLTDENNLLMEKYNKIKQENDLITKKLFNNNIPINPKEQMSDNMNKNNSLSNSGKRMKSKNSKSISKSNSSQKTKDENNQNIKNKRSINSVMNKTYQNIIYDNASLANLSLAGNRVFTLKMMKEIISNIYSSKTIFDQKCLQNKQPKQTMEEFMYTYLNQKYGLKNMVMEWATNIINGIRTFSLEDTEISLFGKILQNELEEECQIFISNIKENINSILLSILRAEYPYKNDIELNKMKNKYIKNEIPPDKTQQIIESLYDEKAKEIIFEKINKEIDNRKNVILKNSKTNGKMSREEHNKILAQRQDECNFVQYDFLIDICLEYQIKLHIKYLKPFVKLFKSIDFDRNGFLNEEQFTELILKMNIFGEDIAHQMIQEFLNNIDPYENGHITFSDIVELLSKINFDETRTILDKFCIKEINNENNSDKNNINNDKNEKKKIKKLNEDIILNDKSY